MTDTITLTGLVATPPKHVLASDGSLPITSFRLASSQRRFDRAADKWIEVDTNWYTVTAFRQLAVHVAASVERGQRIVVTGRLRMRDWTNGERAGTTLEVIADAVGHDLMWGTAVFTRTTGAGSDAGSAPSDPARAGAEAAGLDPGDPDPGLPF